MQTDDSTPPAAEDTSGASSPRGSDARRAAMISTLEGEMVPRLLMLCRTASAEQVGASSHGKTTDRWDVEEFTRLLVLHGPEMAWAFVEAIRQRGVPHERICLDLLAPAAHRLAEQWEHRDFGNPELRLGLDGLLMVLAQIGRVANTNGRTPRQS